MKEFWNLIQAVFAALGGWVSFFLGGNDGLVYALIAFVVIDYLTGVMCAISDKKLSSAVGFKGICRKGAGTNYAKTGKYTGKGVFTITQVKSGTGSDAGWGKLKSGAGWIALSYCTLVS